MHEKCDKGVHVKGKLWYNMRFPELGLERQMKCELCKEADAATVLHRKKEDGSVEELYVCKGCAAKAKSGRTKSPSKDEAPAPDVSVENDGEPPPFVKNFVEAALGLVEGLAGQERGKKTCPGCGRSWEQIKEERRVGCPRCYRTFAESIRDEFLKGAYGHMHIGEMPKGVTGKDSRPYLERELKAAVKRQQFEKAAKLRRRLDELDGAGAEEKPK